MRPQWRTFTRENLLVHSRLAVYQNRIGRESLTCPYLQSIARHDVNTCDFSDIGVSDTLRLRWQQVRELIKRFYGFLFSRGLKPAAQGDHDEHRRTDLRRSGKVPTRAKSETCN